MKTGTTSDRLERAAQALNAGASALNHGRNATFVEKLGEGLQLLTEVLLNSKRLTKNERFNLRASYGTRLLGIDNCVSCWDGMECGIKPPGEVDRGGEPITPDLCSRCGKGVSDCATEGCDGTNPDEGY